MDLDFTPTHSVYDIELFLLNNNDFVVLGTGFEATRIIARLQKHGKNVVGVLDFDGLSGHVSGTPAIELEIAIKNKYKIIVASLQDTDSQNWEIRAKDRLLSANLKPYEDFVCLMGFFIGMEHLDRYSKLFGGLFHKHFQENRDKFESTLSMLEDEYSKTIYTRIIEYKLKATEPGQLNETMLPSPLERLSEFDKKMDDADLKLSYEIDGGLRQNVLRNLAMLPYSYFDIVKPDGKKGVIDAGGFNGDTAVMFEALGAKAVYTFEPIDSLFEKMQKISSASKVVKAYKCGLWDTTKVLRFTTLRREGYIGMGSFVSEDGEDSIDVVSLDEFVKENSIEVVDFIKMDIEGAEIEALNGAIKTIERFKPDLAICIYHVDSHLWEIPLWIKSNFPGYKLYVDHKHIHPAETVCYAKYRK